MTTEDEKLIKQLPQFINQTSIIEGPVFNPKPSSPREFFERIYGNLETTEKVKTTESKIILDKIYTSDSSGDDENGKIKVQEKPGKIGINLNHPEQIKNPGLCFEKLPQTFEKSLEGDNNVGVCNNLMRVSPELLPFVLQGGAAPDLLKMPISGIPESHFTAGFSAFLAARRGRRREGGRGARRQRTTFSGAQTLRLEREYRRSEYVARGRRRELAATLHLTDAQVKIWFQNRRAKDKRIEKAHIDNHYRNILAASGLLHTSPFGIAAYRGPVDCAPATALARQACTFALYNGSSACYHGLGESGTSPGQMQFEFPSQKEAEKTSGANQQNSDIPTNLGVTYSQGN